ncbi:MAG: hypothetical protein JWO36_6634 [Myxococcales bacterium]|nr:hypothetical protein [Myxococcales bacterium]
MRGAMLDVECPRCNAKFPPSIDQKLVTCASCGLVFAPHDVVHRAPLPDHAHLPSTVVVRRDGDNIIITAPVDRLGAALTLFITGGLIAVLVRVLASDSAQLFWLPGLGVALFGGSCIYFFASSRRLVLGPTQLTFGVVPIGGMAVLGRREIRTVYTHRTEKSRWKVRAVTREDEELVIFDTPSAKVADYVCDLILQSWHLSLHLEESPQLAR